MIVKNTSRWTLKNLWISKYTLLLRMIFFWSVSYKNKFIYKHVTQAKAGVEEGYTQLLTVLQTDDLLPSSRYLQDCKSNTPRQQVELQLQLRLQLQHVSESKQSWGGKFWSQHNCTDDLEPIGCQLAAQLSSNFQYFMSYHHQFKDCLQYDNEN